MRRSRPALLAFVVFALAFLVPSGWAAARSEPVSRPEPAPLSEPDSDTALQTQEEAPSGETPEAAVLPHAARDPERTVREARLAVEEEQLEKALDLFERAVRAEPSDLRYGAEYRQAVIAAEEYDRAIDFFEALAERHPHVHAVFLNWGYAYVDKIPAAGAITQVILANQALGRFTEALEREETWLGLYTRGNSYIYWPAIFQRTARGIADLERAIALAEDLERKAYHSMAWSALGDGYWRFDDLDRARRIWRDGLARYPGDPGLGTRLAFETDEELRAFLEQEYEIGKRVATHLRELWEEEPPE